MTINENTISSIIPAAGQATRFGGIPKFLLPNKDGESLLRYHVKISNEICDQSIIVVRPEWASLVYAQLKNLRCEILVKETKTMSETIISALPILTGDVLLMHMPDTFIGEAKVLGELLEEVIKNNSHILGCWKTREDQRGKLGQVFSEDLSGKVFQISKIVDKDPNEFSGIHWGVAALLKKELRPSFWNKEESHLGKLIEHEIMENPNFSIMGMLLGDEYFDLGTPKEFAMFLS